MKRTLKSWLGRLAYGSGLHHRWLRDRAVVLAFHRVDDRLAHDPLACSRREFSDYCRFARDHFDVVPLRGLLDRLNARRGVDRLMVITFDDGYRDNFEFAQEVLGRFGLPACFFVTTDFVGSETQAWWDRESASRSRWMTWDEVRSLRAAGHEIGAHTVTHPDLGAVDRARVEEEIAGSQRRLERELGEPVTLFSYPFGGPHHIRDDAIDALRRTGFHCCLSSHGGSVHADTDPFRIPRIPVTRWQTSAMQLGFEMLRPETRYFTRSYTPERAGAAPTDLPLPVG
jgi:peptidoglycan/xylan/chitin deacetylase (PgdA/CDA1 family)